jgi:hypothetical protein
MEVGVMRWLALALAALAVWAPPAAAVPFADADGVEIVNAAPAGEETQGKVRAAVGWWRGEIDVSVCPSLDVWEADAITSWVERPGRPTERLPVGGIAADCQIVVVRGPRFGVVLHEVGHALGLVGVPGDPHADGARWPVMGPYAPAAEWMERATSPRAKASRARRAASNRAGRSGRLRG